MTIKNFELSNINKMIDRLTQIKDFYNELLEITKEKINDEFNFEHKPLVLINHLEIVLYDCLAICKIKED